MPKDMQSKDTQSNLKTLRKITSIRSANISSNF